MKWKKASEEMDVLLQEHLAPYNCQKRKMFGSLVYFVNGNMFTGVHQDNIFLRMSLEDKERILAENDEVTPFEPMEGRVMKEYISLPESVFDHEDLFREWLELSYRFVSSLPLKEKKSKKRKKYR